MPFPTAHPAAVLPLRRQCPRWFNFPALVIGSVVPDIGYCFGRLQVGKFSHRFIGSFGFDLPVGLVLVLLFYLLRRPVVQRLPARHRQIFAPLCRQPAGSRLIIAGSLLVGAWTHLFLDSLTHPDGWLAGHLPGLQAVVLAGDCPTRVCDLLYAACTFAGVIYVAVVYLNWLKRAAQAPGWIFPGFKWVATLALAIPTLLFSFANHEDPPRLNLAAIGVLTVLLVVAFLTGTVWALRGVRNPGKED